MAFARWSKSSTSTWILGGAVQLFSCFSFSFSGAFLANDLSVGGTFLSGLDSFFCGDFSFWSGGGAFWGRVIYFFLSEGEGHPYLGRIRPLWPSRLTGRP